MARKYLQGDACIGKFSKDGGKQIQDMADFGKSVTHSTSISENLKFPSVLSASSGDINVRGLNHIEEMFLARESALYVMKNYLVNAQNIKTPKVAQKYLTGSDGQFNVKYKWFKNRVMPLGAQKEDDEVYEINMKTTTKEKSKQKRFSTLLGLFTSWMEKRREKKPKKNEVICIDISNELGACDHGDTAKEALSRMNSDTTHHYPL